MKKILTCRSLFIFLLIVNCLAITTKSFAIGGGGATFREPRLAGATFTGTTTYCQNVTGSNICLNYTTCTSTTGSGGGVQPANGTARWYYMTAAQWASAGNTCNTGLATLYSTTAVANTLVNGQICTPVNTSVPPGVYHYFLVLTATNTPICSASPLTFCNAPITITAGASTPITGTTTLCSGGATTTLGHATAGGTWSSSNAGVAAINTTSGLVTTGTPGTATIVYQGAPCAATASVVVTVTPQPTPIVGNTTVCAGGTTQLSNTIVGTWTSSNNAVASVGINSGFVTGGALATGTTGTATITFNSSCGTRTIAVTVNAPPSAISGTTTICSAPATTTLSSSSNGTWTSAASAIASIDAATGVVTAGPSGGTTLITYNNGCGTTNTTVTVIQPLGPITGNTTICSGGATTMLSNAVAGGTWSSNNVPVASATTTGGGGLITSGVLAAGTSSTALISYSNGCGVPTTTTVTVYAPPGPIAGPTSVCVGSNINLTDGLNGTWTSSNSGVATINAATGNLGGVSGGSSSSTAVINYSNGCGTAAAMTVSVIANPTTISGGSTVCTNGTTQLSSAVSGGTWFSHHTSNATVNPTTGLVFGVPGAGGTNAGISYSNGCGVQTVTLTVQSPPTLITAPAFICAGGNATLSNNGVPTGTWTSSNPASVSINTTTGVITGGATNGTTTITAANVCGSTTTNITNSTPTAISGVTTFCQNNVTTLSNGVSGGTWSSGNVALATTTGAVNDSRVFGVPAGGVGCVPITYTLPSGCFTSTLVCTTVSPGPIIGILGVCVGNTTALTNMSPGGVWTSSNTNVATVTNTGLVTGVSGTFPVIIDYTIGTCAATTTVTVDALPGPITGPASVCSLSTVTLSNASTPGYWTSSNSSIATIDPGTGAITGVMTGTVTTVYTLFSNCSTARTFTVTPIPSPISGITTICAGTSTTLSTSSTGGVWSSSTSSVATIDAFGVVRSNANSAGGTTTISYTFPSGCYNTTVVTVNPLPGVFVGPTTMCTGTTTTLVNGTPGGTWSSSNPAAATIDLNTGDVFAALPPSPGGITYITYTLASTGCFKTHTITVNPVPTPIIGNTNVCVGLTTILSSSPNTGTWTSSNTGVATVGTGASGSTIVSAVPGPLATNPGGTTIITYTLPTGCFTTTVVTVNPLPGIIVGATVACVGDFVALTDNTGGGTWSSNNNFIAPVDVNNGTFTAAAPGGTAVITDRLPTGCERTHTVIINPLPANITGNTTLCAGFSTVLSSNSSTGTWTSSNTNVATVVPTGTLPPRGTVYANTSANPGGTTIITYTLPTGCFTTTVVTVNPLPGPIVGMTTTMCAGLSIGLTDASPGGAWSSSNVPVASVVTDPGGSGGGIVTGGGVTVTSQARITYTLPTGCLSTISVTVNPLPAAISGNTTICAGLTTQLSSTTPGGTWSSNNIPVASVTSFPATPPGGLVTGGATPGGSANITYTLISTGCIRTASVLVNPLPDPIVGNTTICAGLTTQLSNPTPGGTWSSSNSTVASVVFNGGLVTGGVSPGGTARITYTLGATGCIATTSVLVNPLPGIIQGLNSVCQGSTINMSNATPGGVWSSSNTNLATIALVGPSGVVFANNPGDITGVDTIIYTIGTGCLQTKTVTVNLQPYPILPGSLSICQGAVDYLSDAQPGGVWSSSNTTVATVVGGTVTAGSAPGSVGTATISYSIGTCREFALVNVNTQPGPITGVKAVCYGATTRLSNAVAGGVWTTDNPAVATINAIGLVSTVSVGTVNVIYSIGSCTAMTTVTVNVQPVAIVGNNSICNLDSTLFTNVTPGGFWSTSNTSASVGSATGMVTGTMPWTNNAVAGSSVVSYTMPGTGCSVIKNISIKVQPLPVAGNKVICLGLTTQLSDAPPGGVWSVSTTSLATISVNGTGLVTGMSAGQGIVTYDILGCSSTATITVNPLPSQITGIFYVCLGSSTTLANLTPGGTWSSSSAAVGINVVSGVATGNNLGTSNITYTLGTGCIKTQTVTVIPVPAPISGSTAVCQGLNTQLSDFTNGGVWTSSNTDIAIIDQSTGLVDGVTPGTVIISYTLGSGCRVVSPMVVHPRTPITGVTSICIGQTTNLSTSTVGGAWVSSNPAVATVNPGTGVVTGLTSGTSVITVNWVTGCSYSVSVTVAPLPPPIAGPSDVCDGSSIVLSNGSTGGVWTSGNPGVAVIDPATGAVTAGPSGITAPVVVPITYTLGCNITTSLTVHPLPAPIVGNPNICLGSTVAMTDATPGGIWSSTNVTIAPVDPSGVVTGNNLGNAIIVYTLSTGCSSTLAVTVNPLPGTITGSNVVCVNATTPLSNSVGGGLWLSSDPSVADVNFITGVVTGMAPGIATITYQIATGCIQTFTMTVNPLPTISGTSQVCTGSSITLVAAGGPGSWSSSNPAVALVDPVTGVVTGITSGTTTIIYTLSTGCSAAIIVTVNPAPAPIAGINLVCTGQTTQLFNTTLFGTWSSSNTYVGTIDVNTGVTGSSSPATSTYIVTYTLPTGCYTTTTVTVTTPPGPITGPGDVCMLDSIQLANAIPGGIWTSQYPANATVSATGEVFGVAAGFTIVTYTMGGGSCYVSKVIVVNPIPAPITGTTQVCHGLTTQLFDATPNGVWTSGNNAIAVVDPNTGVVTGNNLTGSALTVDIFYTLPTGCYVKTTVTVNPLPLPITGNTNICVGGTRTLSDSPTPGTWSSANTNIATVDPVTGVVTGVNYSVGPPPGTTVAITNITYTISATGCIRTTTVAVHPLPQVFLVTGGGSYCAGTAAPHVYLSGSEIGVQYYLYLGATPTGTFAGTGGPLDMGPQIPAGNYTVVAVNNFTTCGITMTGHASVTILPLTPPSVTINASPSGPICAGTTVNYTTSTINGGTSPAYMWSVNGVNVSTASAYSFVPANGDEVTVTFTSTAQCGLPRDAHDTVVMSVTPAALPALNMTVSPNDTVCTSVQVTLSVIGSNVGTAPAYLWYVNGVNVSSGPATTYTYTPSDGDIVYARMSSNAQCRLADTVRSNAETISVKDPVIPGVLITSDPGTLLAVGQTATLTAHVTNAVNPTYQWYINGSPVPGATDSVLIRNNFNYPRPDSVSCVVVNTSYCGEQGFSWIYIVLHPVGVTTVTATNSDINVIPNPNKGVFMVKGTLGNLADEDVSLELTNMLGQVVYRDNVTAKNGKLDQRIELSSTLANGMYMLSVRTGGEHKVFHLVVEQ